VRSSWADQGLLVFSRAPLLGRVALNISTTGICVAVMELNEFRLIHREGRVAL